MDQNSQNIVLVNDSRTALPTKILLLFFSSLDNFTIRYIYYFFQESVDNFEMEHKTCQIFFIKVAVCLEGRNMIALTVN